MSNSAIEFVGAIELEQFTTDEKTIYAVVRAIEIIGEAHKKMPKDIQEMYPDIPGRTIAGTRDKLIHEYFGVNHLVVLRTVKEDLLPLANKLRLILDDFGYSKG